jgi:hypothetical protein
MKLNSRLVSFLFFLLPAFLALAAIAEMVFIPSDPKNSAFLGLSASRLALLGFLCAAAIFFTVLAGLFWKQPARMQGWLQAKLREKTFLAGVCTASVLMLVASYIILAIPDRYLHEYYAVHERARPLLAWLCLVSLQATCSLLAWSSIPRLKAEPDARYKKIIRVGATVLAALAGIWIFSGLTKVGLWPGNAFWGKAGVPVLWLQILLALTISIAMQLFFIKKSDSLEKKAWLDVGICIAIWLAACLLWSNQSFIPGVFSTPARPPAFQIYPDNDALSFDSAAQNLLSGGKSFLGMDDKPLYISFLAILHMLVGSDYSTLYLLQIAVFALIPLIGYLLGKTLHSRQLGVMFAVVLVFREQNAIALTNIIQVSTSKMMLSEMLAMLGVLLFTLILVRWLKKPDPLGPQLWVAGGVLGLTGLVRLNALTILPCAILAIGLALKFKWRTWLPAAVLFVAFVGISILPWSMQSYSTTNDPLAFITGKTGGVIFNNRYTPVITEQQPTATPAAPAPDEPPEQKLKNTRLEKYFLLGKNIGEHYIHNLISMVVMLPPSGSLYQLSDMVIRLPYWKLYWNGELQADAYLIIFMVLSVTSLGLATAWLRSRAAGSAPLLVVLGYNISTALALTSGGRYMVPMDWCVLLYFSIGVVEITRWALTAYGWLPRNSEPIPTSGTLKKPANYVRFALVPLVFLAFGSLPVLFANLPPTRYPPASKTDLARVIASIPELSTGENSDAVSSMLKDSSLRIEHGRVLYPRYYPAFQGEIDLVNGPILTNRNNFDRLTFYLIGTSNVPVILPISDIPNDFAAGADVWVAGCHRGNYLEALLVILQDQNATRIYPQSPPKTACQP